MTSGSTFSQAPLHPGDDCTLSGLETKAMETYIEDSLAAGFICPSASLRVKLATPVFSHTVSADLAGIEIHGGGLSDKRTTSSWISFGSNLSLEPDDSCEVSFKDALVYDSKQSSNASTQQEMECGSADIEAYTWTNPLLCTYHHGKTLD
ncbi:uncharacterized protein ACWYII_018214 [Salvelinus alpinus]